MSRLTRALPWIGALILLVGIGVFLHNRGNDISAQQEALDKQAAASFKPEPAVKSGPLPKEARTVAGRFVLDAVQRKDLAAAWKIAAPEMKAGITYKEWLSGNIPVVPFPAELKNAPLKVDYALPNKALLEVALIAKHKKDTTAGGIYWLTMRTIGKGDAKKWVVVSWVPRWRAPLPTNPSQ